MKSNNSVRESTYKLIISTRFLYLPNGLFRLTHQAGSRSRFVDENNLTPQREEHTLNSVVLKHRFKVPCPGQTLVCVCVGNGIPD